MSPIQSRRSLALDLAFVSVPLLSLLLSAPIVSEVLLYEVRRGEYHWGFWLVGLAVATGLLAAPGYLRAVLTRDAPMRGSRELPWLRVSLVLGLLSSVLGAGFTLLAFWPLAALPLTAAAMCVRLLFGAHGPCASGATVTR